MGCGSSHILGIILLIFICSRHSVECCPDRTAKEGIDPRSHHDQRTPVGVDPSSSSSFSSRSSAGEAIAGWAYKCHEKLKGVLARHAVMSRFLPSVDFRASLEDEGGEELDGDRKRNPDGREGIRAKLKEAAATSIDRSVSGMEGSAKAVADYAGETIHRTAEKLHINKKHQHHDQNYDKEKEL